MTWSYLPLIESSLIICLVHEKSPYTPSQEDWVHVAQPEAVIGAKQAILLGDHLINEVNSTRSLDVEKDNQLKWDRHLNELINSYSQKVNLLNP